MRQRAVVLILLCSALTAGCDPNSGVSGPRDSTPVGQGPGGAGAGSSTADALLARHCAWCHTTADPAAHIDLQSMRLTSADWDQMGNGVALEMAPVVMRMPSAEKRTLLTYIAARGGHIPAVTIPATYTWRLADAIADVPDGSLAPGFPFVVEDGFIDHQAWTVGSSTDTHGVTYRAVQLTQNRRVDRSVFPPSANPSSYLVFKAIPWHGRFYNSRIEGDVRVSRWMSVGLQARTLEPPGRDHREYVRLQFDRDAISIRSAPTPLETWPWGNQPDPRLQGTTDVSGFYLTASEWLHFVFAARQTAEGVRWTARVTNAATGNVIADLAALDTDPRPLEGVFFLHAYSTADKRTWANLVFTADVDQSD